jgi:hypothetical protein
MKQRIKDRIAQGSHIPVKINFASTLRVQSFEGFSKLQGFEVDVTL